MAKHRRIDVDLPLSMQLYEQLLLVHRLRHRPGIRSGLCLECGRGWPRRVVQLAAGPEHER